MEDQDTQPEETQRRRLYWLDCWCLRFARWAERTTPLQRFWIVIALGVLCSGIVVTVICQMAQIWGL